MSGSQMMLLGGGGFEVRNGLSIDVENNATGAVSIVFQPSGLLTTTGTCYFNAPALLEWGSPAGGTPGAGYWVNMQAGSGSGTNAGAARGTWLQLNVAHTFQINSAPSPGVRSRSGAYSIASDSGGVNVVATGSYSFVSDVP